MVTKLVVMVAKQVAVVVMEGRPCCQALRIRPMHTLLPQHTLLLFNNRAERTYLLSQVKLSEVCKLLTDFAYYTTTCCLCFEQVLKHVLKCLFASKNEMSGSVVLVELTRITQAWASQQSGSFLHCKWLFIHTRPNSWCLCVSCG